MFGFEEFGADTGTRRNVRSTPIEPSAGASVLMGANDPKRSADLPGS